MSNYDELALGLPKIIEDAYDATISAYNASTKATQNSDYAKAQGDRLEIKIATVARGDKGDQGIQGIQGIQGAKGDKGDKGDQGIQGIQGIQGEKGDTGEQGIQGLPGTGDLSTEDLEAHASSTSHVRYATDVGTSNAKAISVTPAPTSYVEGMAIAFKNASANTGAVTIDVNGLGVKAVLKSNGNALSSGNLALNSVYTLRYNGTSFILQGEGGEYGTATPGDVLTGTTIGTDAGVVGGTLALTGDAVAGDVLSGKTFYSNNAKSRLTGSIASKTAQTFTPSTVNQTISAGQYLSGVQTILGDPDLIASNILSGKNIFGVDGSLIAGKRFATGTATTSVGAITFYLVDGNTSSTFYIVVSGLTFKPSTILYYEKDKTPYKVFGAYTELGIFYPKTVLSSTNSTGQLTGYYNSTYKGDTGGAYVSSTGFQLPAGASSQIISWIAIE